MSTPRAEGGPRGAAAECVPAARLRAWRQRATKASGGLTLSDAELRELPQLVKQCSPEELAALAGAPRAPLALAGDAAMSALPLRERLAAAQGVISAVAYNHTGTTNFDLCKHRPFASIMETARAILRDPLPIKCLEATFLGMLLTSGWPGLDRVPLAFKSKGADGQSYRHIVLAVHETTSGLWGALGLSRRSELMYKPLDHGSLSSLVLDYVSAYAQWGHAVAKVKVGLPAPHDAAHSGRLCWRYLFIDLGKRGWPKAAARLDEHAAQLGQLQERYAAAAAEAAAAAAAAGRAGGKAAGGGDRTPRGGGAPAGPLQPKAVAFEKRGAKAKAAGGGAATAQQQVLQAAPAAAEAPASPTAGAAASAELAPAPAPAPPPLTPTPGGHCSSSESDEDDFETDSQGSADDVVIVLRSPRRR